MKKYLTIPSALALLVALCHGCVMSDIHYPVQEYETTFYESLNEPGFPVDSVNRRILKSPLWKKYHCNVILYNNSTTDSIPRLVRNNKADKIARFFAKNIRIKDKPYPMALSMSIGRVGENGMTYLIGQDDLL